MRYPLLPLVLLCAAGSPAFAQEHAQRHNTPPAAARAAVAQDAPAQRWLADAPLREGMGRIGRSVAAFQHYEHGHMNPGQVTALVANVRQDVQFLVANCKLEPAADAALHSIIAKLLLAAQALKTDPGDRGAIPSMRAALRDYARQFDDPGFNKGGEFD